MLQCPVRDCHMALVREERRLFCQRGHSFDVARSGYINLLQPQDRRSKHPGDTVAAVAARRGVQELRDGAQQRLGDSAIVQSPPGRCCAPSRSS